MGTSGAYGGSRGWNDTRTGTDDWVNSKPNSSGTDGADSDSDQTDESQPDVPVGNPPVPSENPLLASLLGGVARHLSMALPATGTGGGGGNGGGGGAGGAASGVRGRRLAPTSGGVAIAAVHGLRNGEGDSVGDAGLTFTDLVALPPFEQARRIVDAASGPSILVEEAELREVNANFVCWAIQQELLPSPEDLVKQWVTEYVYRVWLTEAGDRLRDGSRDGSSIHALEQEARVTLEARVSGLELPVDGVRATHFAAAIQTLLGMLSRIFR